MHADDRAQANAEVLSRVVTSVIGDAADATFDIDPASSHIARARLLSTHVGGRTVGIRASVEWFDVTVFDLGVSATIFDYVYTLEELAGTIEALAQVAREYLLGGGKIEWKRDWFRTRPELRINTARGEWRLGRYTSTIPPR